MTYYSKNRRISSSVSHKDFWIVDCIDGKFFPVHGTSETLQSSHPPDPNQEKAERKFHNDRINVMSVQPLPQQRAYTPKLTWNKSLRKWA